MTDTELTKAIFEGAERQQVLRDALLLGHITAQEYEKEMTFSLSAMFQSALESGVEPGPDGWMRFGEVDGEAN